MITCKMPNERTEEFETFSILETYNFALSAKVSEFSSEIVHRPGNRAVLAEYSADIEYFRNAFRLFIYANGNTSENEGCVSFLFQCMLPEILQHCSYFEFSCVVAVIDASGNRRFLRAFTYPHDPTWSADSKNPFFALEQYIRRETLLGEPLDFLPGDCLSMHADVKIQIRPEIFDKNAYGINAIVHFTFVEKEESGDDVKYSLLLDSKLAKSLKEVSSYFRAISDSPMKEGVSKVMNLPAEDYPFFKNICYIVMGARNITVKSLEDIRQMYILADKYDIPLAVGNCRRLVSSFLRDGNDRRVAKHVSESIAAFLELAEEFKDVQLKQIVENFPTYKEQNVGDNRSQEAMKFRDLDTEWRIEVVGNEPFPYFVLSKDATNFEEKPHFDFYL